MTDSKPDNQLLGSTWEIKTRAESLEIQRPDGEVVTVAAAGGRVLYVLAFPGDYRAGTHHVTATAADTNA